VKNDALNGHQRVKLMIFDGSPQEAVKRRDEKGNNDVSVITIETK
jgi:hypothetical protein